jgi:hypothetical protein
MRASKRKLKGSKVVSAKDDIARLESRAANRSLPNRRASISLAVAFRRQTSEQQRHYNAAVDGFLAEWVRQHLDSARGNL